MLRQALNNQPALLLFLCIPALVLLRIQFDGAAGHMDEYDYLFVGKTLLAGNQWPTHTYIFSWDLNWLILAWGESVFGGLQGARVVAAVFGAISLVGMYAFVHALWRNHLTAFIAALLLGFEGAHLYTSALATYDIISFTAFTCALPFVLYSCQPGNRQLACSILSCCALSVAVLSKYTTVVYLPLIAALVLVHSPRHALMGALLIATVLIVYTTYNFDQLKVLYEVQIQGTHGSNSKFVDILNRTARQLSMTLFLAGLGIVYTTLCQHTEIKRILILATFSLPLFIYHLASQNVISLQKHLVFSSLFLIPIIAWWLSHFYNKGERSHFKVALILICIAAYAIVNVNRLKTMQKSYPDVGKISTIASQIRASESVLSEDPYLFRYLLIDTVAQERISETTWLDNNQDGKFEKRDVRQAVWDRKFDYVFLNDQQHQKLNTTLRKMLATRNYELVYENHYQLDTMSGKQRYGAISMHRKAGFDTD